MNDNKIELTNFCEGFDNTIRMLRDEKVNHFMLGDDGKVLDKNIWLRVHTEDGTEKYGFLRCVEKDAIHVGYDRQMAENTKTRSDFWIMHGIIKKIDYTDLTESDISNW